MARIQHRNEPSADQLRVVEGGQKLKYPVNLVADAIKQEARDAGFAAPLFSVKSGYRSSATQRSLWERALARYGSEEVARRYVAPPGRSAHVTGGTMDFDLGNPIDSSAIPAHRASPAYQFLREIAPKYKITQYEREPWHWECDDACEQNILAMEESGSASSGEGFFSEKKKKIALLTVGGGFALLGSYLAYNKLVTGEWLG